MTKMQTLPNTITRPQTVAKGGKIAEKYNMNPELSWAEAAQAAGINVPGYTAKYYAESWAADTGGYLRQTTVHEDSVNRALEAHMLHESGLKVKDIATYYGISSAGASQLVKKGDRIAAAKVRAAKTTETTTTETTNTNLSRDSDIRELSLSTRAEKVLLRKGIYTVNQLMLVTEDDLGSFSGCGKTTASEIVNMRDRMIDMFII